MINIDDSGWRIMRDIRDCSELFKLSEQEIEYRINEIKDHLGNSNKTYFRQQRNVIDLFVAITTSGYIDNNLTDQMLNMAKDLYGSTKTRLTRLLNSRELVIHLKDTKKLFQISWI